MFKRIFLIFSSSLILFACVSPVFSSAAVDPDFTIYSSVDETYLYGLNRNQVGYFVSSGLNNTGYFYYVSIPTNFTFTSCQLRFGTNVNIDVGPYFTFDVSGPANTSFQRVVGYVNLKTGSSYSNTFTYTTDANGVAIGCTARTTTYFSLTATSYYTLYAYSVNGYSISSHSYLRPVNNFVRFLRPESANYTVHSMLNQPVADLNHFYIADSKYLYSFFVGYPSLYLSLGTTVSSFTTTREFYSFLPLITKKDVDTLNLKFRNATEDNVTLYVSKYDVVDGKFISVGSFPITVATSDDDYYVYPLDIVDPQNSGIWYTGFVNGDGLDGFSLLKIVWDGQLDYHPDFVAVESLLNNIYSKLGDIGTDIATQNSIINRINSSASSIVDILNTNFAFIRNNFYNDIIDNWNLNFDKLDRIISILQGSSEQTTLPGRDDVQEGVSDYIGQESDYMNQYDDSAAEIEGSFNDISNRLSSLSSSFSAVNNILQAFVFDPPINGGMTLSIFLFSLTFGLLLLIIGRKLSN